MTTPEKTVEERVKEVVEFHGGDKHLYDDIMFQIEYERQKREEVVDAERERLLTLFSHQEYIKRNALVDALTQPNNK